MGVQGWQPFFRDQTADDVAGSVSRQRLIEQMWFGWIGAAERIELMLKETHHQYPWVMAKCHFGAVTVVHIKIDNGDTLQTMDVDCMTRGNRDVIEQTKTHWRGRCGVMTGRTDGTEGIFQLAGNDRIGSSHGGARCTQGGLPTMCVEQGIAVERIIFFAAGGQPGDIVANQCHGVVGMDARNVAQRCLRRFAPFDELIDPAGNELVFDGLQAQWCLRMIGAHFMALTVGMGIKSGRHYYLCLKLSFLQSPSTRQWLHCDSYSRSHLQAAHALRPSFRSAPAV